MALRTLAEGTSPVAIALPASGGQSTSFASLAAELPASWAVLGVDLPGHGAARGQPLTTIFAMADRLACALGPELDGDVILLGQSLGGLVAYELAARLRLAGARLAMIGIIGAPPPHRARELPVFADDDDVFIEQLAAIGGIPAELRGRRSVLKPYIPVLRTDLKAVRDYRPGGHAVIDTPVAVYGAPDDPWVPAGWLAEWAEYCSQAQVRQVGHGHFAVQATPREVAAQLVTDAHEMMEALRGAAEKEVSP